MCGIAGCSLKVGEPGRVLETMLDAIEHRGPDGRGRYIDQRFAMGNTLLSIVDVGHNAQPFHRSLAGERYVGFMNGEVYNYRALRTDLEHDGVRFETDCDTEVAVAAVAVWGTGGLARLDGQWALALWSAQRQRLLLARDPFGIKPLYYWSDGPEFAFASEPKAILTCPGVTKAPDITSIMEYFLHGFAFASGYATSGRSFYRGLRQLPPGHWLEWRPGAAPKVQRHFVVPLDGGVPPPDRGDVVDQIREAVSGSIAASMIGDVPVGVALSGGLDSSVVARVAADCQIRAGKGPMLASCIRYAPGANADAEHAGILSQAVGPGALRLVFSTLDAERYLADVDRMVYHFDEPHWEVKQLAMFNNYRVLRENGAKVVLAGEGADELFFGYYFRFPGFVRPEITNADHFRSLWSARIPWVASLLRKDAATGLGVLIDEAIGDHFRPYESEHVTPARRMQIWYLHTFLHWLLMDNDRCSMAHSVEARVPFLNRDVYSLALRIPPEWQVGRSYGQEKLLLREAFSGVLPREITSRPKSPLPSPLDVEYHAAVAAALGVAIDAAPSSIWEVLCRARVVEILSEYRATIDRFRSCGPDTAGEHLTSYLHLEDPWALRTPHAFALLTLIRWWATNFR